MTRQRRRARRVADVDYDRAADAPVTGAGGDGERAVSFEEDWDPAAELTGREVYDYERPPHHGGD